MAKYKYEYRCPDCGTELELKMRVTQTKRKCPHCGKTITAQEIDRQEAERLEKLQQQQSLQEEQNKKLRAGVIRWLVYLWLAGVVVLLCAGILMALGIEGIPK